MNKKYRLIFILLITLVVIVLAVLQKTNTNVQFSRDKASQKLNVYWIMPSGFRAEPVTMKIYEWAKAGKLPSIRWMMENGSYGYSLPEFKAHTATMTSIKKTLEERGKKVSLVSASDSIPSEIFHSSQDTVVRLLEGLDEHTQFLGTVDPESWGSLAPKSQLPPREVVLENLGQKVFALIYAESGQYDHMLFSFDKKAAICDLKVGQWSDWRKIDLNAVKVTTKFKIKLIQLGGKDFFRVRFLYGHLTADDIEKNLGPMVDFADKNQPQLVYVQNDKPTFLEESDMSLDWHKRAVEYFAQRADSEVVIHKIKTPNQMLISRWWLPYVDPKSDLYKGIGEAQRQILWNEILHMYHQVDDILGEVIRNCGVNCVVVFGSDQGVIPLNQEVLLNNLFAKEGLLKFSLDKNSGKPVIDQQHSQVIFLERNNINISANAPNADRLLTKVEELLKNLKDANGKTVFRQVLRREGTSQLQLVNEPGFSPVEVLSDDAEVFHRPVNGGYYLEAAGDDELGMWTPFMIVGPGVKKGFEMPKPIRHVDQFPTIMKAIHQELPPNVEGHEISEIFN